MVQFLYPLRALSVHGAGLSLFVEDNTLLQLQVALLPVGFEAGNAKSCYQAEDAMQLHGFEATNGEVLDPCFETKFEDDSFCAPHWPKFGTCATTCTESSFANGSSRPHLLFLHTEKTGGSSVECATQHTFAKMGIWTNMGHTSRAHVDYCRARCSP